MKKVGIESRKTMLPLQDKASSGAIWPEQDGKHEMFENSDTEDNVPGTARREKDKMQGSWEVESTTKL